MFGLSWIGIHLNPWPEYSKFEHYTAAERRNHVLDKLEDPWRREWVWVVVVAGMGFFIDAYSIWSINMVFPMLGEVYYGGTMPHSYLIGINIATLGGTILGQIGFGLAADRWGRRKMYGHELVITIAGTLGCAMASTGSHGSMSLIGWLCFWRVIIGLGIGADYPLSAVICSEMAPTARRGQMLTMVFACQPLGQVAASLVALIGVYAARHSIPVDPTNTTCDEDCIRAIDIIWRVVIGFGAILAAIALWFRITIIESPRYTLDVARDGLKAALDMSQYYPQHESVIELNVTEHASDVELAASSQFPTEPENSGQPVHNSHIQTANGNNDVLIANGQLTASKGLDQDTQSQSSRPVGHSPLINATDQVAQSSKDQNHSFWNIFWQDFKDHYWQKGNFRTLVATSLCWGLLDLPFYGLGTSDPAILNRIWSDSPNVDRHIYGALLQNAWQSLLMIQTGAIIGVLITLYSIKPLGTRVIQMNGFFWLFILFVVIGASYKHLLNTHRSSAIVVLYILCQIFFNFGPNTTTYIIPAELYPTRFRCTCHGISAATGKLGSVIAQVFLGFVRFDNSSYDTADWLGYVLLVFSASMLAGLFITVYWIPETRSKNGDSIPLEELAEGRPMPNKFSKSWMAVRLCAMYKACVGSRVKNNEGVADEVQESGATGT